MRRLNEREKYQIPRAVFPSEWAVYQRPDVDPAEVSDRPPPHHRFVGRYLNVSCVPICNADGIDNMFGVNRDHDTTRKSLEITDQPRADDWQLGQVKGRGKVLRLNEVRINEECRQQYESQKTEQEYHRYWGLGRGTVVEKVDAVSPDRHPGHSGNYPSQPSLSSLHLGH